MTKFTLLLLLLLLSIHLPTYAQDGTLDPSFGTAGTVITTIGTFDDEARAIAMQADGKIVIAGHSLKENDYDFAVVRYLANGDLDPSFGNGGYVVTPLGTYSEKAIAVCIQEDGKIIAAGSSFQDNREVVAVVRYSSTGVLDQSFNQTGKLLIPVSSTGSYAAAMALQADHKIVLTGGTQNNNQFDLLTIRINPDGTLDNSFGTNGIREQTISSFYNDFANTLLIQPDSKIVIGGYTNGGNNADMLLVRYLPNGSVDPDFGNNGKIQQAISGTHSETISSMVLQADGKIVVAGNSSNTFLDDILVRFLPDGNLDNTFGNNGIAITDHGLQADIGFPASIALQEDGRLVTVGYRNIGTQLYFSVLRYTSSGLLDSTFGTAGKVVTAFDDARDQSAYAIALQSDGKIIAAGGSYKDQNRIALARYNAGNPVSTQQIRPASTPVTLYPNPCPVYAPLTIQHPAVEAGATIILSNLNGTAIHTCTGQPGTQSVMTLPNVVPGVYVLSLTPAGKSNMSTLLMVH